MESHVMVKYKKNIIFILFISIIVSSCSVDKDYAYEPETFSDFEYDNSEIFLEAQHFIDSTENLPDNHSYISYVESILTEKKIDYEYKNIMQKCISDAESKNSLGVVEAMSYDFDDNGDSEILVLATGGILYFAKTLYVYKVLNDNIQCVGEIVGLQCEICDDIFDPFAEFKVYNQIKFGKLNYNDRDYNRIICYSIRTPYYHHNWISQLEIDESGTVAEVYLLEWGLDIKQKYNGFDYVPVIRSYLDGEEKEITNEGLRNLLSMIQYDDLD